MMLLHFLTFNVNRKIVRNKGIFLAKKKRNDLKIVEKERERESTQQEFPNYVPAQ